jgi:mRNA interferase MazF
MSYLPISHFIDNKNLDSETIKTVQLEKDFDAWTIKKKEVESSDIKIICNEREIWWCSLGLNIGHEQDGKNEAFERPVLILRKFSKFTCLCVPLTTSNKNNFFYKPIPSLGEGNFIITSQIKLISTKRLIRRFEKIISWKDFREIKKAIHNLIN